MKIHKTVVMMGAGFVGIAVIVGMNVTGKRNPFVNVQGMDTDQRESGRDLSNEE